MPPRPRAWADLIFTQVMANNTTLAPLDILFDLGATRLDTITIVRLVGYFGLSHEALLTPVDGIQRIDVGIGVASEPAFASGNVPEADISTEYPPRGWLYATTRRILMDTSIGTAFLPEWEFDMRASRKLDKGILYLTLSNNNVIGAGQAVLITGRVRALCLT